MNGVEPFFIKKNSIYAVPVLHYNMETAAEVKRTFDLVQPDCIAVELAETMQPQLLHAAARLPDITVVLARDANQSPLYYLCEPCDAAFEGIRCALEKQLPAFCIDLDVDFYPDVREFMPDPYSIHRIGLRHFYEVYRKQAAKNTASSVTALDTRRELHMARRLKELSLSYDRILFISGMAHVERILQYVDLPSFPPSNHAIRDSVELCTLTEASCRDVMAEFGWISSNYEMTRQENQGFPPDRQKMIYRLYKQSVDKYIQTTGYTFPSYHLRNIMKFVRNYALTSGHLMPDLFQIITAAKGCVDHNYAYETWELATSYPHRRNLDNLPELTLSIQDLWGTSKLVRFHLKEKGRKDFGFHERRKNKSTIRFHAPSPFSICSHQPEDVVVEKFGDFLKKKGTQIATEEAARVLPFSTSLEDGIDIRETIRHWHEKKLYVKVKGKPLGGVGSIVVIFDEDNPEEGKAYKEKYGWHMTWLGEHSQESDMAFYGSSPADNAVGPGISRCEYGGFMMSYPPRRMYDVWSDPDYSSCRSKGEVLLTAAIDYAVKPTIVYVAAKPPRSQIKSFASRFGKKIVYIPLGQLSPVLLNKIRIFHVLDGRDKRAIADDYIY